MSLTPLPTSYEPTPQPVSRRTSGVPWSGLSSVGDFLLGLTSDRSKLAGRRKSFAKDKLNDRKHQSVGQIPADVALQLKSVESRGEAPRRVSSGDLFSPGQFADNLLSSLRVTPVLSRKEEGEEEDLATALRITGAKEKQKRYRLVEFSRKILRNSGKSNMGNVIDLGESFQELRRSLNLEPRSYPETFDHDSHVLIGEGANGHVYASVNRKDKKRYAVKIFNDEIHTEPCDHNTRLYRRFMREAVIGSVVSHMHCGITHDVGFDKGRLALVMEHYPMNFVRLVNSGKARAFQLNHHFRQLVAAIHYLHTNGIAHRDLKLENLCVSSKGELKVIDFGSAVLFNPPGPAVCADISGTDQYIAPEMLLGGSYDAAKADMWSMGILYLAMLARKLPWALPSLEHRPYKEFLQSPSRFMSQFQTWDSNYIPKDIVLDMLNPIPESRITIQQLVDTPWYTETDIL